MITSESRTRTYASVGTYEYEVDRTVRVIEISEALAQYAELDAEQPKRPLLLVNKREPIIIDLAADDLRNAAQQLTDAEKAALSRPATGQHGC